MRLIGIMRTIYRIAAHESARDNRRGDTRIRRASNFANQQNIRSLANCKRADFGIDAHRLSGICRNQRKRFRKGHSTFTMQNEHRINKSCRIVVAAQHGNHAPATPSRAERLPEWLCPIITFGAPAKVNIPRSCASRAISMSTGNSEIDAPNAPHVIELLLRIIVMRSKRNSLLVSKFGKLA